MKKDDTVYLPLASCKDCPNCDASRYYTADSWEDVTALNCRHSKYKNRKNGGTDREEWKSPPGIALLDWNDKAPPPPKWCPLRKKQPAKGK